MRRALAWLALLLVHVAARGAGLSAERLGVVFNLDEGGSEEVARYYAMRRQIPTENLLGVHLGQGNVLSPGGFDALRTSTLRKLPSQVQSLALVWSRPFAVGCMSVTSAFAAGYRAELCEPGCGQTAPNPLFDAAEWLPADTVAWWPAMLIPGDAATARALIDRGIAADRSRPNGFVHLVRTANAARNVRAVTYADVRGEIGSRARVVLDPAPPTAHLEGVIGYFTGIAQVSEISNIAFLPGAIADHLTSTGGVLFDGQQSTALQWIAAGATASYGTVSEPCAHLEKFPDLEVLWRHYLRGETALESYWKSVAMPGQGLFVGEPLARPFASGG